MKTRLIIPLSLVWGLSGCASVKRVETIEERASKIEAAQATTSKNLAAQSSDIQKLSSSIEKITKTLASHDEAFVTSFRGTLLVSKEVDDLRSILNDLNKSISTLAGLQASEKVELMKKLNDLDSKLNTIQSKLSKL